MGEWLPGKDPATGRPYYYNSLTFETHWEWPEKLTRTDTHWRELLSPEEYQILRNRGCEAT